MEGALVFTMSYSEAKDNSEMAYRAIFTVVQYNVIVPPGGGSKMCFVQICAGNPSNQIRGCDRHGCGNYGARRYDCFRTTLSKFVDL